MADEDEFQAFMAFNPEVRAWRNAFIRQYGESPRIDGSDFDYRVAYAAGNRPQAVPGDSVPHWGSVGKADNHPTLWKQTFMEKFGVDPDAPGIRYTPEMQEFLRRQIGGGLLGVFGPEDPTGAEGLGGLLGSIRGLR